MRVTRLYLQNYRVYEDPVELELPPGLVGIYGPNGAGKSLLVESIRWTLYGRSRTAIDEIRTAQINAECITEVQFEHEGHLYLVRRTLSGINNTVKATAHADGMQVAEGARDVTRYVHSILGMDDAAFRASVFAEQKQLDAFSDQTPADRRKLVLQLLGITPVDAARDEARKRARDTHDQFEKLRSLLPDLDAARNEAGGATKAAELARQEATTASEAVVRARDALDVAQQRCDDIDRLRQEHELVDAELRAARTDHQRSVARAERLAAELAELERVARRMVELRTEAGGLSQAETRLRMVEAWIEARRAVAAVQVPAEPPNPDVEGCEQATQVAQSAREQLAEIKALLGAARAELERARQAVERSSELSAERACPLCGQTLGTAFEQVRAHRAGELAAVEARVGQLDAGCRAQAEVTRAATAEADRRRQVLQAATTQRQEFERAAARRGDALARLAAVQDQLGSAVTKSEHFELTAEVQRRRKAAEEVQRAQGRLERRGAVESELEAERVAAAGAVGRVETLSEKLSALHFDPARLAEARAARDRLRTVASETDTRAQAAQLAAAQATSRAEAAAERKRHAEEQHAQLAQLGDHARHLGRLAELLSTFRNELVSTAGPRLSMQAAELFAELTDNEYDRLEVDADTYEIRVRDSGLLYGMNRFSGSETDLANLALRVAIAEQVRFQAGGAVGLLVLDEVFGPLDEDRKERMLLALERLRGRFRQVLVVTHDATIKEQLPNAIEVVKLPGRRAIARLVHA